MNSTGRDAVELEAELLRLHTLVRKRRAQLARLEVCPNKECECRAVWKEHIEKALAGQVGKIRKQVRHKPKRAAQPAAKAGRIRKPQAV
jgi:hypothetical protein